MGLIVDQQITDRWAAYCGDNMAVLPGLPKESIHLSVYSPPFMGEDANKGLYSYTSSELDLSNSATYEQFFDHYEYIVREIERVTIKGRMSAVHCMDVPSGNTGKDILADFPGDIIRLHKKCGMDYTGRYHVWKEPLTVRNRTMTHSLSHRTIVEDATRCSVASADYVLMFRKRGENPIPVTHPTGMLKYAGEREVPQELMKYKGWTGKQTENRYSHWIWRQYASAFWDDIRIDRVLPFRDAKEVEDSKHPHPLQRDVIERIIDLWSNEGETVLTPFMGVGSEVYSAVLLGRKGIGTELKPSYYAQAIKNLESVDTDDLEENMQLTIDDMLDDDTFD